MYIKRKLQNLEGAIVDCTDENEVIETYEEPSTEIEAPLSEHVVQKILYDLNGMEYQGEESNSLVDFLHSVIDIADGKSIECSIQHLSSVATNRIQDVVDD